MKKINQKKEVIFLSLFFLLSLGIFYYSYIYTSNIIKDSFLEQIKIKTKYIENKIELFNSDKESILLMLIQNENSKNYIVNQNEKNKKKLEQLLINQIKASKKIFQARVLDLKGNELVRIDKKNKEIIILEKESLQNKFERDYFKKFIKLKKDEIGFSKLDLNVEYGKIEKPFQATIRLAMPIFIEEEKKAIMILNYNMNDFLEDFRHAQQFDIYILNRNGFYILNPNKELDWSEHINNKVNASDTFNLDLEKILSTKDFYIKDTLVAKSIFFWDDLERIVLFKSKSDIGIYDTIEKTRVSGFLIIIGILAIFLPVLKIVYNNLNSLKRKNIEIENSEKKLLGVLDNTFDSIIMIDDEGIIKTVNKATLTTFGYKKEELLGENVKILVPKIQHDKFDNYIKINSKTNKISKSINTKKELFGQKKDSSLIIITLSISKTIINNELFFIGTIRDITEEKNNKVLFQTAFDNSPLGKCLLLENKNIFKLNEKFANSLGYEIEELLDLSMDKITHKDDIKLDKINFDDIKNNKLMSKSWEKRYLHKDNSIIYSNISATAIYEDIGKSIFKYFIIIVEDVTEKKKMLEKEKLQEYTIMQQSKLASMGEMVTAIAHQWRQPLNAIGLTIHDLVAAHKYGELDALYVKEIKDDVNEQLKYMSDTIDEFRNFFKQTNENININLSKLLKDVSKLLWAQLEASCVKLNLVALINKNRINIDNLKDEQIDLFYIKSKPSEIKQILINLVSNAKDAISMNKGQINIKDEITIEIQKVENYINISVIDYAGGMENETINRIFEPYFTTKNMGTGLGLYISQTLAQKSLNSEIICKKNSTKENLKIYKGTIFSIKLKI